MSKRSDFSEVVFAIALFAACGFGIGFLLYTIHPLLLAIAIAIAIVGGWEEWRKHRKQKRLRKLRRNRW